MNFMQENKSWWKKAVDHVKKRKWRYILLVALVTVFWMWRGRPQEEATSEAVETVVPVTRQNGDRDRD